MSEHLPASDPNKLIILGKVTGYFGVKGWVKVFSYTDPKENIVHYKSLLMKLKGDWQPVVLDIGKLHGKGVVAHFKGFDSRDESANLLGAELAVTRADLKPLSSNDYYWQDLIGLQVRTLDDIVLGRVKRIIETAAHDVLIIESDQNGDNTKPKDEILIPFVFEHYIEHIDLDKGFIQVDWQPEWNND